MEEKKDCFAHKVRGYCSALTEMVCQRWYVRDEVVHSTRQKNSSKKMQKGQMR
jgi:hypothetical protein